MHNNAPLIAAIVMSHPYHLADRQANQIAYLANTWSIVVLYYS